MTAPGVTPLNALGGGGGGGGNAVVSFGAGIITKTVTTRYLFPWFSTGPAPTSPLSFVAPRDGTLQSLYIRQDTAGAGAELTVYTMRVNGVPSALAVSVAASATGASNLVDSIAVLAGDLVDLEVTKAVPLTGAPSDITASMEFV